MNFFNTKDLLFSVMDKTARLKPSAVLSYCQEIADEHAVKINLSNSLLGGDLAWILTRVYIALGNHKLSNDKITLSTCPVLPRGISYPRECVITQGTHMVAEVVQEWTIIDKVTRRLLREGELDSYQDHCKPASLVYSDNIKVRALPSDKLTHHHDQYISMNHIDILGHVNNTNYADFVTACLDDNEYLSHILSINITFIKEVLYGETLHLYRMREGNTIRVQGYNGDKEVKFAAVVELA